MNTNACYMVDAGWGSVLTNALQTNLPTNEKNLHNNRSVPRLRNKLNLKWSTAN